jgi:hypothetical protein
LAKIGLSRNKKQVDLQRVLWVLIILIHIRQKHDTKLKPNLKTVPKSSETQAGRGLKKI